MNSLLLIFPSILLSIVNGKGTFDNTLTSWDDLFECQIKTGLKYTISPMGKEKYWGLRPFTSTYIRLLYTKTPWLAVQGAEDGEIKLQLKKGFSGLPSCSRDQYAWFNLDENYQTIGHQLNPHRRPSTSLKTYCSTLYPDHVYLLADKEKHLWVTASSSTNRLLFSYHNRHETGPPDMPWMFKRFNSIFSSHHR